MMIKRLAFLLGYTVFVLAVFAYSQSVENERMALALSGQYAVKMADASDKLMELEKAVDQSLLFAHPEGAKQAREDIWRLSSDIRNTVTTLPFDQSFTTSWSNYLGRIGNYAREAERESDPAQFHQVMSNASRNFKVMADDWQIATAGLVDGTYDLQEWVERLDRNNPSVNWSQLGSSIKQYTESDFPLTTSESDAMKKRDLKDLTDSEISEKQAINQFKKLFPNVSNSTIGVEMSEPTAPYPFYHIRFANEESVGYIDITKKGGYVLSYLADRSFGKTALPFKEVKNKAENFLKRAGFKDVVMEEARENATVWHLAFVRIEPENQAKVFSDMIHLKIAKDNAEVIGLNTAEYIRKETLKKQPIKKIDWATFFHEGVRIESEELAYVENERLEQRLSYYLTVTKEEGNDIGTYRVIVDTETSEVIKTEKLT